MITLALQPRGATLEWPLLTPADPLLTVHDPVEADWLHLLIGERAYVDLVSGREWHPVWEHPLAARLRHLAFGHWLRAWWPASVLDGVPPLNLPLLDAEIARLSDSLDEIMALSPDEIPAPTPLPAAPAAAATQADYALVAGGDRPTPAAGVLSGTSPHAWQGVPAGRVDASENAVTWVLEVLDRPEIAVAVHLLPGAVGTGLAVAVDAGGAHATGTLDAAGTATLILPLSPAQAWALNAADVTVTTGVPVAEEAADRASIRRLVAARRSGTADHNGPLYQAERALLLDDW